MEVYIEWTYMMNALIILWSWEILCFLLNQSIDQKKLFIYMLLYNVSIFLMYVDMFNGFILIYYLGLSVLLFRELVYIYYPLFVFAYVSIISFMHLLIKDSLIFQGILLIQGLSLSLMVMICLMMVIFIYFYLYYCKYKIHNHYVDVFFNKQHYLGFVDNGNQVSYQGCPVIFMKKDYIEGDFLETIEVEVINSTQMIDIVQVKDICINHHVLHDVYVGVLYECEYDCILNNQLLGGFI